MKWHPMNQYPVLLLSVEVKKWHPVGKCSLLLFITGRLWLLNLLTLSFQKVLVFSCLWFLLGWFSVKNKQFFFKEKVSLFRGNPGGNRLWPQPRPEWWEGLTERHREWWGPLVQSIPALWKPVILQEMTNPAYFWGRPGLFLSLCIPQLHVILHLAKAEVIM